MARIALFIILLLATFYAADRIKYDGAAYKVLAFFCGVMSFFLFFVILIGK